MSIGNPSHIADPDKNIDGDSKTSRPTGSSPGLSRVFVLLSILFAWGLRLTYIDAQSLWYDEGVTAMVARYDLVSLTRWTADDIQPPLYYYIIAGWGRIAGWSEWNLRFPSAVTGTLLVPLIGTLALRMGLVRRMLFIPILLSAIHPFLLYYSQEARMYALLLLLCVFGAYCLLQALDLDRSRIGRRAFWMLYIMSFAAALYTHYFAIFLLLALGLAALILYRESALSIALANFGVLTLFTPWIGTLLRRLELDTSYWSGTLKIEEALRHIAIGFTSGETVFESVAVRLLWIYAGLTIAALWGWRSLPARQALTWLALWILLPIVAVLTLSSMAPKFNVRYVSVALPGLILLWSVGIGQGLAKKSPVRPAAALSLLLLLLGSGYANYNWFYNSSFSKDQWRELITYIEQHHEDSASVLVSGHAWPVWQYYAPDAEVLRLPQIETLDVDATLNFENIYSPLKRAIQRHDRVWLIEWQEKVIDPMGVVPLQLERAGRRIPTDVIFWGIDLHHYEALDPSRIESSPPIEQRTQINYSNLVTLEGHTLTPQGDLLLFWKRISKQPLPDLYLVGDVFTAEGTLYSRIEDRRLSAYEYPSHRWRQDEITVGRLESSDWIGLGALSGTYPVHLSVYSPELGLEGLDVLDGSGGVLGKDAAISVQVDENLPILPDEPPSDWATIAPGVQVYWFADDQVPSRSTLEFTLFWYAQEPAKIEGVESVWKQNGGPIIESFHPISFTIDGGQILRSRLSVQVPYTEQAERLTLELFVPDDEATSVSIPFTVLPATPNFDVPELDREIEARFQSGISILGLVDWPESIRGGETLHVKVIWKAEERPSEDVSVTLQILNREGQPIRQVDRLLPDGTSTWRVNEIVTQPLELQTPAEPGQYRLILAQYRTNGDDQERIPLAAGEDSLDLGILNVAAP